MDETHGTLAIFSQGWQVYQDRLSEALAPLSNEQLALRAAPELTPLAHNHPLLEWFLR